MNKDSQMNTLLTISKSRLEIIFKKSSNQISLHLGTKLEQNMRSKTLITSQKSKRSRMQSNRSFNFSACNHVREVIRYQRAKFITSLFYQEFIVEVMKYWSEQS